MASARYVCGRTADDVAAPVLSPDDVLAQHERHVVADKLRAYYVSSRSNRFPATENRPDYDQDRHYLLHEFPEVAALRDVLDRRSILLECGCGVGNALYPLLAAIPNLDAVAVDFSDRAIGLLQKHPEFDPGRIRAFAHDLTVPLPATVHSADICTMLFVLSAITPANQGRVVDNIREMLRDGGVLVLRDYAYKDMTQLRFDHKSRLDTDLYVRRDGTLSYFFKKDELERLFTERGFEIVTSTIVEKVVVNRKEDLQMQRRWLQCVFRKS